MSIIGPTNHRVTPALPPTQQTHRCHHHHHDHPPTSLMTTLSTTILPPDTTAAVCVLVCVRVCVCLQGYMVVPEGDSATAIERWFYVPWLSQFAEEGGVSQVKSSQGPRAKTLKTIQ